MSFTPANIPFRISNSAALRYSFTGLDGRPRLLIHAKLTLLAQVKGEPKYWRLDLDLDAHKGRLTGLINTDGHPATRIGQSPHAKGASTRFTWVADEGLQIIFRAHLWGNPPTPGAVALLNPTVTSLGIEFDLPAQQKKGGVQ